MYVVKRGIVRSSQELWKTRSHKLDNKLKRIEWWDNEQCEDKNRVVKLMPFYYQFSRELRPFPVAKFPMIGYWIAKEMLREYSPNFGEQVWPNVQHIIKERMIQLKDEQLKK